MSVTVTAPVNIALIKYWGKKDPKNIIPTNDSLSFTLCQDDMCATTSAMFVPLGTESKMWLNGKETDFNNPRVQAVLSMVKKMAKSRGISESKFDLPVRVASSNNFPTAAGLASSAAGYAALAQALASLYGVTGNLSGLARIGSGSACRSMFGGFVQWKAGEQNIVDNFLDFL
jgi:diphosphomevalonate decarboxylase